MDPDTLAQEIIEGVMRELYGRGGFDHWWDSIDAEVQDDILDSLKARVANQLVNA